MLKHRELILVIAIYLLLLIINPYFPNKTNIFSRNNILENLLLYKEKLAKFMSKEVHFFFTMVGIEYWDPAF